MEKEQTKVSFSNFDKSLDDGKGTNKGLWPHGDKLSRGQKAQNDSKRQSLECSNN